MAETATAVPENAALVRLGRFFFKIRSFTPVPLILVLMFMGRPSAASMAVGIAVALAGEAVRWWGMRHIGGAARTRNPDRVDAFIVTGPYRHMRNPLYVGNFITALGFALMSDRLEAVLLVLFLFPMQYIPIVAMEELHLHKKFGAEFEAFCVGVPRWLPQLDAWGSDDGPPPVPHADVWHNERSSFGGIAAVTALMLFLMWRQGAL